MTTNLINDFINAKLPHWVGDGVYACALWAKTNDRWHVVDFFQDPYDGIEPLVSLIKSNHNNQGLNAPAGLLEMFGKMSNILDPTEEKFRVRVLFSLNGQEVNLGVQKQGETDLFLDSNEAEGQFVEFTNAVLSLMGVA